MTSLAVLDPLVAAPAGWYFDELVVVRAAGARGGLSVHPGPRLEVCHGLRPDDLDDDLAERLAAVLAPHSDDHEVFIRAFVGIVITSDPDPFAAWTAFYRNSLARFDDEAHPGYVEVYRHAIELLPHTSVLDLGCGFGFLALHLNDLGVATTAADVDPGTVDLLATMAARLRAGLTVRRSGPDAEPFADNAFDAVALLHVLEHVDDTTALELVRDAVRIARRRVVIAVPYETRATRLYGHDRVITPALLHELGRASGHPFAVHEHCGGWLVIDV